MTSHSLRCITPRASPLVHQPLVQITRHGCARFSRLAVPALILTSACTHFPQAPYRQLPCHLSAMHCCKCVHNQWLQGGLKGTVGRQSGGGGQRRQRRWANTALAPKAGRHCIGGASSLHCSGQKGCRSCGRLCMERGGKWGLKSSSVLASAYSSTPRPFHPRCDQSLLKWCSWAAGLPSVQLHKGQKSTGLRPSPPAAPAAWRPSPGECSAAATATAAAAAGRGLPQRRC